MADIQQWSKCLITDKEFSSFRGFLNHLRSLKISSKEYYDRFLKKENEGKCLICEKPTVFGNFGYNPYCSCNCSVTSEKHRKAVSERFIDNPDTLQSFRSKSKITLDLTSEEDKQIKQDKRIESLTKRAECLGMSLSEMRSINGTKHQEKVTSEERSRRILKWAKTIEDNGNKPGRSGYKKYPFFDTEVSLQGYEPYILTLLVNHFKFSKDEILCSKGQVPIIKYNNGKSLYFPDFYLPKFNLLIEVKSTFTYDSNKENVHLKCEASVISGYSIALLVLSNKEVRKHQLDGSKNILHWAISSQAPSPQWYGEGSSTIPSGVENKLIDSRNAVLLITEGDIVSSSEKSEAVVKTTDIGVATNIEQ